MPLPQTPPPQTPAVTAPAPSDWAFAYPAGVVPGSAPGGVDLRALLNEPTAGSRGFVRRTRDGRGFADGAGKPLRFWCANVGDGLAKSDADLDAHARFLAGLGVNLARVLSTISPKGDTARVTDVDEKEIDRIWRTVAAMKKAGVYTSIQPWWAYPDTVKNVAPTWGLDGYRGKTNLFGVVYFNDTLEQGYRSWLKALYGRVNPHTGVRLADDPAVAVCELVHEDSVLFWTLDALAPPQKKVARERFAAWLTRQYGSPQKALDAWGKDAARPDDEPALPALLPTFDLTQPPPAEPGKARRLRDQVRFLAETQRDFYARTVKFLREEVGVKSLISPSNWRTADSARLGDAERWTHLPGDVEALNSYYNGGVHQGPNASWRIDPGDLYDDRSVLKDPAAFPLLVKQTAGRPFLLTETNWLPPLTYQAEGPFLAACYQSLTGVDGTCWYVSQSVDYATDPYFPYAKVQDQRPLTTKWSISVPTIQGMFPAAALIYRRGYVREAAPVLREARPAADLWDRRAPLWSEGARFDPVRDTVRQATDAGTGGVHPLAGLVGPLEASYGDGVGKTRAETALVARSIDPAKRTVRSATGELTWDYGAGLVTLDAPKAQGVCGFVRAAGGRFDLSAVRVESGNDYAAVAVVSLDDRPLTDARRVLVQIGTEAHPTGWRTEPTEVKNAAGATVPGRKIVNVGAMPFRIAAADVRLRVRSRGLRRATLLDPALRPLRPVPCGRDGGWLTVTLPPDAMYLVLE